MKMKVKILGGPKRQMPILFIQGTLNHLVRDLDLFKTSTELLASRLSERKMLTRKTKVFFCRDKKKSFFKYFSAETNLHFVMM